MNATILESSLAGWIAEFDHLRADRNSLPGFLARRIVDSGLTAAQDDWDVVTANVGSGPQKVRIKGFDKRTHHLQYESMAMGRIGFGLCRTTDVNPDDHGKLADILDRIEGKR